MCTGTIYLTSSVADLCPYSAWSADPLEKHVLAKQDRCLEEGALTEQEALAAVSSLSQ